MELVSNIKILSDAKIIILTGDTDIEQREYLFKEGILDYIVKDKYFNDAVADIAKNISKLEQNCDTQILIIDDSRFLQKHITAILTYRNYNTFSAFTAKEGLELLENNDINLIILDMELPDTHGLEFLRKLRKNKLFNDVPVMILSAHNDAELVRDSYKAGAFDFIRKPFHIEELLLKVDISVDADRKSRAIMQQKQVLNTYKEELEENLNISNENFSEAYKISQEYQKAIDESTILSRTDSNGKITYANDRFCEVTGYTQDELLGKTHGFMKDPQTPITIYEDLWDTITSGKVWHGQLKNSTKNKNSYYANTTIVPIIDSHDNIIEYLAIRDDITEIILAHKYMNDAQKEIIYKMGDIGESRSLETGQHVKRVAEYSKLLATFIGLSKEETETLYAASPMHDIGKVGIPDSILKKPAKLTADEWEVMKTHSELGYNILKDSPSDIFQAAAILAHEHHERWDGSGYPNALKEDTIHIFGRITAVADVFDALGSKRCYKGGWTLEKIITYFKEEKAKHFDPQLVDILLENMNDFLEIKEKYTEN